MKEIQLTQGQVALVDDWRYDELNAFKWCAQWDIYTKSYYVKRNKRVSPGKWKLFLMHAVVAGTPQGMETDHINHDTLDNREENLRICTHSQNQGNRGKQANNTSGYCGVVASGRKWMALIKVNKKQHYLGTYSTPEEAARVYDEAAKNSFGKFAMLNFTEKELEL